MKKEKEKKTNNNNYNNKKLYNIHSSNINNKYNKKSAVLPFSKRKINKKMRKKL